MPANPKLTDLLNYFTRLAQNGELPGASGGAVAAAQLAKAVLENVSPLDFKAVEGLYLFIALAKHDYPRARDMIERS